MRAHRCRAVLWLAAALFACSSDKGSSPGAGGSEGRAPAPQPPPASAAATRDAAPSPPVVVPEPPSHWYRVVAEIDEGAEVPFFLGLSDRSSRAQIKNGEERLEVLVQSHAPLRIRVPVIGARIELDPVDGGAGLQGFWYLPVFAKRFPLRAQLVDSATPATRFPGDEAAAANIEGRWQVDIEQFGIGRAVFRQNADGTLTGSVIPQDVGDLRHLAGRVLGNRFVMSTFDGSHAYLVTGTIGRNGDTIEGRWHMAAFGSWGFKGVRGGKPAVETLVQARLKAGKTRVTIPELERPEFKGQPVLVDYFGTWCPACLDLTPVLVKLHNRYADQGLKIISIALEPNEDREDAPRRIAEFKAKFGVTWDIDIRYTDEYIEQIPPEIENAYGFPITVFVRRDGTVAGVHTAFVSDAARPEHLAVLKRFDDWALEIVRSKAP